MTHIVFQEADIEVLQKAIELDETLAGNIVHIKDDYAVGPIDAIYEPEGYQQRRDWWAGVLEFSPYKDQLDIVDDKLDVHQLIKHLQDDEAAELWIWMGQNVHDVCGYYWLMSQLKDFAGRVQVLYLNNLPFINDKGLIFYPTVLHEIQPKEFLKAKKLARTITLSEFEVDPDEWKKLYTENAMVRFLEGGKKVVGKGVDFYDKDILAQVTKDGQKLQKVLNNVLSKMKIKTGDAFLVWRMRTMAENLQLNISGGWNKSWKDIEVKLMGDEGSE